MLSRNMRWTVCNSIVLVKVINNEAIQVVRPPFVGGPALLAVPCLIRYGTVTVFDTSFFSMRLSRLFMIFRMLCNVSVTSMMMIIAFFFRHATKTLRSRRIVFESFTLLFSLHLMYSDIFSLNLSIFCRPSLALVTDFDGCCDIFCMIENSESIRVYFVYEFNKYYKFSTTKYCLTYFNFSCLLL